MDAPHVERIGCDSAEPHLFGPLVVPRLLEAERVHAEHERPVRVVVVPCGQRCSDSIAQGRGVAAEEVDLMPHHEGEGVAWIVDADVGQRRARTGHVTRQPRRRGLHMPALARSPARRVGTRHEVVKHHPRGRGIGRLGAQQP